MTKPGARDKASSIRQRLLNLSRKAGQDFNLVLTRFALERFLYRLSKSRHSDSFILKGALLFTVWEAASYRPTRDLDLLAFGDPAQERLNQIIREICQTDVEPDGLWFDPESCQVSEIRPSEEYQGVRLRLWAYLKKARIRVQIDIGFGDVVTPAAQRRDFPTLLDLPRPRILVYPPETVVAEKLQAMVALGPLNSRMKDFYDLRFISREFALQNADLAKAIRATFDRRLTEIPDGIPTALGDSFAEDDEKKRQWHGFLNRSRLDESTPFTEVIADLRHFLLPPLKAASKGDDQKD